ncbi:MAG: hypothetical protein WCL14_00090 [Bacteroidota bacterium]
MRALDLNTDESKLAVVCGDGSVRIIDMKTMAEETCIEAHQKSVFSVKFHPTKQLLLSGGMDAQLMVWEIANEYKLRYKIPVHNLSIYSIVFSPNNRFIATGSRDKTVKIWDADSYKPVKRLDKDKMEGHQHSVNKLLWTKHNNYLLSTGDDKALMVWEVVEQE